MPRSSRVFLAFLLATTFGSVSARAAVSQASVTKVLAFYQTEASLDDSFTFVEAALERQKREIKIPTPQSARILSIARRIYRKKNLYGVFQEAYTKNTTLEAMRALYQWQLTVKGSKLRQGFTNLYAENPKTWATYFAKESPVYLKPNRKNAISTFVTSSALLDTQISKALGGELAVSLALNAFSPKATRDTVAAIQQRVAKRRHSLIEPAREQAIKMAFFMLRAIKNAEIDELTVFATSVNGQAAIASHLKALDLTFESAATTLASQILKGTK